MTVNQFFNGTSNTGGTEEQNLVESNIIEVIQLSGHDIFYIPRTEVKIDEVLNENPLAKFESYHIIEMYLDNPTEFGGTGAILGPHGLEIDQQIQLTVSRKRFIEETSLPMPTEGDLLYWPLTKTLWQISKADHEPAPMWQLKELYVWTLKASLYNYSYEDFETGITEVDDDMNSDIFETEFNDADVLEDEARDILDFSETNPFGKHLPDEE